MNGLGTRSCGHGEEEDLPTDHRDEGEEFRQPFGGLEPCLFGAGLAVNKGKDVASRAADSLRTSYRAGQAGAWKATGGKNEVGVGSPATAGNAFTATPSSAEMSAPPAWAARVKRGGINHGASMAAHTVRSGDHGGGSMSVSLDQDDRR